MPTPSTTPSTEENPLSRPEIAGLFVDPRTNEPLTCAEGWLWSGTRKMYPVFDDMPIVQPQGFYKLTSLIHRLDDAHRALEVAAEKGVVEVFAPETAAGREACHASNRLDHFKDAGELFWGVVKKMTEKHPENRKGWALDIGCGYGFDMVSLCRNFDFVIGFDPQIDRCVTAKRMLREMGFDNFFIFCGTGEELPLRPGTFDLVTANQVVEHMGDRASAFAQIEKVLKPGGQFVFALPTRYSLRPEPHVHLLFVGWLPRVWQGWYARIRGRSDRYAEYTYLISHRALARLLRKSFQTPPKILSAAEVYTPKRPLARKVIKTFQALVKTPLRPLLLEFEGAMVGTARKREKV